MICTDVIPLHILGARFWDSNSDWGLERLIGNSFNLRIPKGIRLGRGPRVIWKLDSYEILTNSKETHTSFIWKKEDEVEVEQNNLTREYFLSRIDVASDDWQVLDIIDLITNSAQCYNHSLTINAIL